MVNRSLVWLNKSGKSITKSGFSVEEKRLKML